MGKGRGAPVAPLCGASVAIYPQGIGLVEDTPSSAPSPSRQWTHATGDERGVRRMTARAPRAGSRPSTAFALLAASLLSLAAQDAEAAASLSCTGRTQSVCRETVCESGDLFTSLSVDRRRSAIEYCVGEGCYRAGVTMVAAGDGSVSFAFDARRSGRNGRLDGLVTLHPGWRTATVGNFLADGQVAFSRLECQPEARQ